MQVINYWPYGLSLGLGGIGALSVALWGERLQLLDTPNHRSSHEKTTPRGGGIGILAAFGVLAGLLSFPLYFWVPAVLVALVSFGGDRFQLGVVARLLVQFLMAAWFLCFVFIYQNNADIAGGLFLGLFYLVFIVGTANYYNFMDGINGIAGLTGIVAFGLLGIYGKISGEDIALVHLCFAVMSACMGFLPFNMPKARVFMGDVGSVLLGFVFAGVVVLFSDTVQEFVLLAGFLFPFYADELVTLVERLRDGDRLARAHRRHLYQVLANEAGVAHWRVSAGYGLVQLMVGMILWKVCDIGLYWGVGLLVLFFVIFVMFNNEIKSRYQSLPGDRWH